MGTLLLHRRGFLSLVKAQNQRRTKNNNMASYQVWAQMLSTTCRPCYPVHKLKIWGTISVTFEECKWSNPAFQHTHLSTTTSHLLLLLGTIFSFLLLKMPKEIPLSSFTLKLLHENVTFGDTKTSEAVSWQYFHLSLIRISKIVVWGRVFSHRCHQGYRKKLCLNGQASVLHAEGSEICSHQLNEPGITNIASWDTRVSRPMV